MKINQSSSIHVLNNSKIADRNIDVHKKCVLNIFLFDFFVMRFEKDFF